MLTASQPTDAWLTVRKLAFNKGFRAGFKDRSDKPPYIYLAYQELRQEWLRGFYQGSRRRNLDVQ